MKSIQTSEDNIIKANRLHWISFLETHRFLTEKKFHWVEWQLNKKSRWLEGKGKLTFQKQTYKFKLLYSPFFPARYDRIYITSPSIGYNNEIHMYGDLALCLYHPVFDVPNGQIMPLHRIVPWISEWIINYKKWQKYGIWFSDEIAH